MRSRNGHDNFYKNSEHKKGLEEAKIWLNLSHHDGAFSQLLIGFIDGASNQLDKYFDGFRIKTNNPLQFYSKCNEHQLAIQGLPSFLGNETIPLGISSSLDSGNRLRISLDPKSKLPKDHKIILQDNQLNILHDLNLSDYYFNLSSTGSIDHRFKLRFEALDHTDGISDVPDTKISWHHYDNHIYISTTNQDTISKVKIYDLNGRCLKDIDVGKRTVKIPWTGYPSSSIYLLKTILKDARIFVNKILP